MQCAERYSHALVLNFCRSELFRIYNWAIFPDLVAMSNIVGWSVSIAAAFADTAEAHYHSAIYLGCMSYSFPAIYLFITYKV